MKVSHLYEELKLLDICKPVSPEEAEKRDIEGPAIKLKERLDNTKKTKLPNGTWHVHEYLDLSRMKLTSLKELNVSITDNSIDLSENYLTNLDGSPDTVNGFFDCSNNMITSLVGGPTKGVTNYYCYLNQLTTLEGCPPEIRISLDCHGNQLTSLKGCPKYLGGYFDCYNNKLTSLKDGPTEVDGARAIVYTCHNNAVKFTDDYVKSICSVRGQIRT